jgi:aryl-alcohol dehydrogenase-like predicted oxidoreductase
MARGHRSSRVARLALGTAQLGMPYGIANRRGPPGRNAALNILAQAHEAGIEWLDTAPGYGKAEALVGRFLKAGNGTSAMRVCTKLPGLRADLSAAQVRKVATRSVERSRRVLGRDTIDLYLLHQSADLRRHGAALTDCLGEFTRRGWIRRVGASVYAPAEARAAVGSGLGQGIQYPFNLLDRRFVTSGCAAALRAAGSLSFARSPLLQGVLGLAPAQLPAPVSAAGRYLRDLSAVVEPYRVSPVAAAIAFAAQESGADWVVAGVEQPGHLAELAAAMRLQLPAELVAQLQRRFARVPAGVRDPRRWGSAP